MGKPLPAHIIAAVVAARHIGDKSWVDISTALQIHPESARQAYKRARERAKSDDILEILKCVYPLKSPGRPSKHRQGDNPIQSAEGGTGNPLQQDTDRVPTTSTPGQATIHTKRRQELGNAQGNQKQQRRKRVEVERPQVGEQTDLSKAFDGNIQRPGGATVRIEQPTGGMNSYGYDLGQFRGGIGPFTMTFTHT